MSIERNNLDQFEQAILPYLDAAYDLARWIMSNDQDAEDMVQDACLRAFQYFGGFHGGNSRAWLLTIVRNTCYTWLQQNRAQMLSAELDDELYDGDLETANPEASLQQHSSHQQLHRALEKLPVEFRELIVLRELEEFSYKEIAGIAGIPMGTVMSRLARARQQLRRNLVAMDREG